MLLALVLCFDYRKSRDIVNLFELHSSKGHKYIWYALPGYAIGLVTALAAGVLTHSPQPALLYLVLLFFFLFLSLYWFHSYLYFLHHLFLNLCSCHIYSVCVLMSREDIKYILLNTLSYSRSLA